MIDSNGKQQLFNVSVAKRDGELVIYKSSSSFPFPSNWSSSVKFHLLFAPVAHSEFYSPL